MTYKSCLLLTTLLFTHLSTIALLVESSYWHQAHQLPEVLGTCLQSLVHQLQASSQDASTSHTDAGLIHKSQPRWAAQPAQPDPSLLHVECCLCVLRRCCQVGFNHSGVLQVSCFTVYNLAMCTFQGLGFLLRKPVSAAAAAAVTAWLCCIVTFTLGSCTAANKLPLTWALLIFIRMCIWQSHPSLLYTVLQKSNVI